MNYRVLAAASLISLAACGVVGPEYVPPEIEVPPQYRYGDAGSLYEAATRWWWTSLNDPLLNDLMVVGLAQNLSIETAIERIEQAQIALLRTGANQTSGDLAANAAVTGQSLLTGRDLDDTETRAAATVGAGYVFDLFGRLERRRQAADAEVDAAIFGAGTARLAFQSALVSAYIEARFYQSAAAIARQTIESRQRTLDAVNRRREVGDATVFDVEQARALLATARGGLPSYLAQFEARVYEIATLLAEPAAPLLARMQSGAPQPRPRQAVASGLPADLLRNRPDIRAAERELAAAVARIGVAEADLYPSLSLAGDVSVSSGPDFFNLGPNLSLPLFNRTRLRLDRQLAVSQAQEAELLWRREVYEAIEEVQISLAALVRGRQQVQAVQEATASTQRVVDLAFESYEAGGLTLTEVIDAERRSVESQLELSSALRDYSLTWARLQVATGTGWYAGQSPVTEAPAQVIASAVE